MLIRPHLSPADNRRIQAMLFGNQNGDLRQQLLDGAPFLAELTHTAVPQRAASGTTGTFTRATTSTWPNNDGYMVKGVAGEIGFVGARRVRNHTQTTSEDFSNAAWTKSNTTVIANQATAPNGTLTADLLYPTTTGTLRFISQTISGVSIVGSTVLGISVYAKPAGMSWMYLGLPGTGSTQGAYFNLSTGAIGTIKAGASNVTMTAVGNGWYRCSLTQLDTSDTFAYPVISVADADNSTTATTNGTDGVYIWGAQLEDVTAQTTQEAGEYVSVGVESAPYYHGSFVDGVKCFPTDLSGNPIPSTTLLGYQAQGARTNLCLQSQTFGTTWGTDGSTSVAENQYIAPDGTATMDRITSLAVTSQHYLKQAITFSASTTTYSCYLRYVNNRWAALVMSNGGGILAASFDLLNGVTGAVGVGTTSTIEATAIPDVYRCSITGTMSAGAGNVYISPNTTDSASLQNYTAAGTEAIGAWGAQVELGSFASSYIPTTTIAVARNADVLTYSIAGNYSATVGWLSAEYSTIGINANARVVGDGDTTSANTPLFASPTAGSRASIYDGTTSTNTVETMSALNTMFKGASTWGGSTKSVSANGVTPVSGAFDGNVSLNSIGIGVGGSVPWFGTIRNVRIGQRQLSASELQAITS